MRKEKFKVCFYKKDVLYFITFFIITFIACIFIMFNEQYRAIGIFGLLFIIGAILLFVSNMLFKIEVDNNCFKVRTKLGMKHEFNLSEIEKIYCLKRTRIWMGTNYYIRIYAKNHFFEVNNTMESFETLAEYIIQMYINNELYENTLNKKAIKELKFYASNKYSIN